jgi:hypothetical protein
LGVHVSIVPTEELQEGDVPTHGRQMNGVFSLKVWHVDDVGRQLGVDRRHLIGVRLSHFLDVDGFEQSLAAFDVPASGRQVQGGVALAIADVETRARNDQSTDDGRMVAENGDMERGVHLKQIEMVSLFIE